ncbi:phospholipase domain-containing protein [Nonomuraea sp. M3C6]|uniref:Phospholipase domain-containing protein n=1 Tax=Nonomuraea marmarensis TaxID=3351344 RepID=A0ABW7A9W3_9ACTN
MLWHAATKRWVMVVWSDAGGNGVNVYTSPNLFDWTFQSRFAASWLFECPDLFELAVDGDKKRTKWVLTDASGGSFYAAQVFNDMPDGRVVQMAWMGGNQGATWTGNASFPAVLGLRIAPEAYGDAGDERTFTLKPGHVKHVTWHAKDQHGWYDLRVTCQEDESFLRRLMGHIENGEPSVTG